MTSTGWTQRTGSWPAGTFPTYYTSTSTGTRTILQGRYGSGTGTSTGTSIGTLTGTVTGVLGSNLTGTATYDRHQLLRTNHQLLRDRRHRPVGADDLHLCQRHHLILHTIDVGLRDHHLRARHLLYPDPGRRHGATPRRPPITPPPRPPCGRGAAAPGRFPGTIAATLTGTNTAPWDYYYREYSLDNLAGTIEGVVSPGPGGTQVGAMTVFPSNPDTPFMSSLIPAADPLPVRPLGRQYAHRGFGYHHEQSINQHHLQHRLPGRQIRLRSLPP